MASDPAAAALAGIVDVSRETSERLQAYVALLLKWQKKLNLIGPRTVPEVWTRHVADSAQLLRHAPAEGLWLDLGSGAGLPGLIVAICGRRRVVLVESDARKCIFLREAIRATGADAEVINRRIEAVAGDPPPGPVAVVSARALAPLPELFALARPFFGPGTIGLFQKGERWADELTAARESWIVEATPLGSMTHPDSVVLRVTALAPRSSAARDEAGIDRAGAEGADGGKA